MFGGAIARALLDLNNVILRFIKWDMDGTVPHAARVDEVGDIAKALKAFQSDAIDGARATRASRTARFRDGWPRSSGPRS